MKNRNKFLPFLFFLTLAFGLVLGTLLNFPMPERIALIERLRAVTALQVKVVADKYFGDDALTVATLLPQPINTARKPRTPPPGARH